MSDPVELELLRCARRLPKNSRVELLLSYQSQKRSRTTALLLSLLLGNLGIDRFYLGDIGLGVCKMLTLGGLGIWAIIYWFLIMSAADEHNRDILSQTMTFMDDCDDVQSFHPRRRVKPPIMSFGAAVFLIGFLAIFIGMILSSK
jgi:TM2 domain-containing membrane protein YozV